MKSIQTFLICAFLSVSDSESNALPSSASCSDAYKDINRVYCVPKHLLTLKPSTLRSDMVARNAGQKGMGASSSHTRHGLQCDRRITCPEQFHVTFSTPLRGGALVLYSVASDLRVESRAHTGWKWLELSLHLQDTLGMLPTPESSQQDSFAEMMDVDTLSVPAQDQAEAEVPDSQCPHILQKWADENERKTLLKRYKSAVLWAISTRKGSKGKKVRFSYQYHR